MSALVDCLACSATEYGRCEWHRGARVVLDYSGETKQEMVKDPAHYTTLSPEPIDVIESWGLGFHLASALKYIARAGRKVGNTEAQDLRKAIRFLTRKANQLEGKKGWE